MNNHIVNLLPWSTTLHRDLVWVFCEISVAVVEQYISLDNIISAIAEVWLNDSALQYKWFGIVIFIT